MMLTLLSSGTIYDTLQSLIDSFAPPTVKVCSVRRRMPWYNEDIHLARRKKTSGGA